MPRNERIALIRAIEDHRGSRVICCVTSDRPNAQGVIAKDFIPVFFNHLVEFGGAAIPKLDVFLCTLGGDTLAAFGLGRVVREFTDSVAVLAPEKCQSAGTLFALGANEIFMGRAATLTPIDPSVNSPLGPVVELVPGQRQSVPVSVESVAGYRNLLKEDWKADPATMGLAFRMLAEKINPLVLGDVYRSRQQIGELARALLSCHRKDAKRIQDIVSKLTGELGSHDYLISRTEARKIFGKQISSHDAALEDMLWRLFLDIKSEMKLGEIFDVNMELHAATAAGNPLPMLDEQNIVMIESTAAGDKFERVLRLTQNQMMTPTGPTQVPQATVVRAGWRHYN